MAWSVPLFLLLFFLVGASWSLTTTPSRRVSFPKLQGKAFRHRLDRDITSFLEAAPFSNLASDAIRRGLSLIEQGARIDLLSSSLKVSSEQLPALHDSLVEACTILDFDKDEIPDLYVQSNAVANAYTLALRQGTNRRPIVVVTSALVDKCTPQELQAILGHELGHLKCEHSVYFTLANVATTPLQSLPLVGRQTQQTLQDWRLAAEYSCDRAALLVAQDSQVVNGAMLKLVSGMGSGAGAGQQQELNVDAFVKQCLEYEKQLESANPLIRAMIQRQQRTHPLPIRRVAALEKWSASDEYRSLVEGGIALGCADDQDEEA